MNKTLLAFSFLFVGMAQAYEAPEPCCSSPESMKQQMPMENIDEWKFTLRIKRCPDENGMCNDQRWQEVCRLMRDLLQSATSDDGDRFMENCCDVLRSVYTCCKEERTISGSIDFDAIPMPKESCCAPCNETPCNDAPCCGMAAEGRQEESCSSCPGACPNPCPCPANDMQPAMDQKCPNCSQC